MGYSIRQSDDKFTIRKENYEKILLASNCKVKLYNGEVDTDCIYNLFDGNRWEVDFDDYGNLDGIQFTGENGHAGDDWLPVIAPYVEPGSFIEMFGEDGRRWRLNFDGNTMTVQHAKIVWE